MQALVTCSNAEDFVSDLSKAFFMLHEPDRQALKSNLSKSKTEEEIKQLPYRYWKERWSSSLCMFYLIFSARLCLIGLLYFSGLQQNNKYCSVGAEGQYQKLGTSRLLWRP